MPPARCSCFPSNIAPPPATCRRSFRLATQAGALIATAPMTPAGLPPDEYYCNYVLKAPRHSFIGFSIDMSRCARSRKSSVAHALWTSPGTSPVSIGWTSSNLNHPWFEGSHWIPEGEDGDGRDWRARSSRACARHQRWRFDRRDAGSIEGVKVVKSVRWRLRLPSGNWSCAWSIVCGVQRKRPSPKPGLRRLATP